MANPDVSLRYEFEKLVKRFDALVATVSNVVVLLGGKRVWVAANYAEVQAGNFSAYDVILVKSDPNGDFATLLKVTSGTVNGITVIQDAVGTYFQVYE